MLSAVLLAALAAPSAEKKPVLLADVLVSEGLTIPGVRRVNLPAPTRADGPAEDKKTAAVNKLAEDWPEGQFVKRSADAPFKLDIKPIEDGKENRRGHKIDLYFIAYGTLKQVQKD